VGRNQGQARRRQICNKAALFQVIKQLKIHCCLLLVSYIMTLFYTSIFWGFSYPSSYLYGMLICKQWQVGRNNILEQMQQTDTAFKSSKLREKLMAVLSLCTWDHKLVYYIWSFSCRSFKWIWFFSTVAILWSLKVPKHHLRKLK